MVEPEGAEVSSTQKSLSSSHDPGWNDPPKWAFTPPQTSCATPTKRVLNKRVAFPLNSATTASNSQSQSPMSLPPNLPPPASFKSESESPGIVFSRVGPEDSHSDSYIDKEKSLSEALLNLETVIEKHIDSKSKAQEVQKRIETMKSLWLEDKLDSCIHRKVLDISKALKEEDAEKADKIHISLMLERAALCSSWIPGIRHLILEMKCKFTSGETTIESGPSLISLSLEDTQ
ncbi:steroid receptor RNA activator 1-like [Belonocnema kinseyi]|uniref:steroid receptor RNA activator 1-like n=1 Tax=Belonocnema kinseyi TaxID=2817044 RepID=UPI00143D3D47|nr:steroid receptor RNA activator 1-like [Belonocnema kinseyi]